MLNAFTTESHPSAWYHRAGATLQHERAPYKTPENPCESHCQLLLWTSQGEALRKQIIPGKIAVLILVLVELLWGLSPFIVRVIQRCFFHLGL